MADETAYYLTVMSLAIAPKPKPEAPQASLTLLEDLGHDVTRRPRHAGIYLCSCGNVVTLNVYAVRKGDTRSCGCFRRAHSSAIHFKHGWKKTKIYDVWHALKGRCCNPTHKVYDRYGGRGITVCDRWMNSFENFLADMGQPPSPKGYSLDRVDNNGPYSPDNCRWATRSEQNRNKRTNRLLTHQGQTKTLVEWSVITGLRSDTIDRRLRRGWPVDRALDAPLVTGKPAT